ncbi:MAG: response regulator, partial [Planctomycetota bacterium]
MARILIVDDAAQNLALLELYLRDTEFEVATAANGAEAIEACQHADFELILLDVVMPGVGGFEVCRRLKNDPRTAFIPVIFLTARSTDESEKLAAYQLGAVDYLQKPVTREELIARMRVMLRLEQARVRLDRENLALRGELGRARQAAAASADALHDLQHLRQQWTASGDVALLVVDRLGRFAACD